MDDEGWWRGSHVTQTLMKVGNSQDSCGLVGGLHHRVDRAVEHHGEVDVPVESNIHLVLRFRVWGLGSMDYGYI